MSKPTILIALLASALLGAVAAPAGAASSRTIIDDCASSPTGLLQGTYSKGDLDDALDKVRGDVAEYTGCHDAIKAALRRARSASNGGDDGTGAPGGGTGGGGTSGGGLGGTGDGGSGTGGTSGGGTGGNGAGGGFDSSGGTTGGVAGDRTATADGTAAPATAAPPVQQPGSDRPVQLAGATITPGFGDADGSGRSLPTPLIVFLVLLAVGAVGVAAPTIGRRVLARRRT